MEKFSEIVINRPNEKDDEEGEQIGYLDWILAVLICSFCIIFLIIAVKVCYNYSKKFPAQNKENDTLADLNRRGISLKGTRGVRYSVA